MRTVNGCHHPFYHHHHHHHQHHQHFIIIIFIFIIMSQAADLEQVEFPPRRAGAYEEVFGEQEALPLPFLPEGQRAQPHLAEHSPLAARRQLDQRAWGGETSLMRPSTAHTFTPGRSLQVSQA